MVVLLVQGKIILPEQRRRAGIESTRMDNGKPLAGPNENGER